MPQTAEKILHQIGAAETRSLDLAGIKAGSVLKAGSPLIRGESLFPRVVQEKEDATPEKKTHVMDLKPEIDYEEFAKVDLRVAKILTAEAVPKSSKLLKLKVDIGEERTIVAGVGKDYSPEQLVGRQILVVANLKPVKLMGVESHGMLLATDTDNGLTVLTFDREAKTGAKVR
jgi:methionyl-tRNA synthetase